MSDPMPTIRQILGWPPEPTDDLAYDLGDYKAPGWVDDVEDRAEQWAGEQQ